VPHSHQTDVHARQNNVHTHSEESQKDNQSNQGQLKKE
jgi:ribosomal protein S15P/S13E